MKKTTGKYRKAPRDVADAIDQSVIVRDFLPSPEEMVLKEKTRKVTINLSENSLNFFKNTARKYHVSYQKMIKRILDRYSDIYMANHKS
jgi:predicted DNA binding CopG/RHH family protein